MNRDKMAIGCLLIMLMMVVFPAVSSTTQDSNLLSKTTANNPRNEDIKLLFKGKISYLSGNQPSVPFYKFGLYIGISELILHVTDIDIFQVDGVDILYSTPCNIVIYNSSGFGTPGILMMAQVLFSHLDDTHFMISCSCDDYQLRLG